VSEPRPADIAVREWPLGSAVFVVLVGVGVVVAGHFRIGCVLVGLGVLLAAALRALLPERRAGLLVVRNRVLDVSLLCALGAGVVVMAVVVPG
jgi:Protein of unknown function (DUF3017)